MLRLVWMQQVFANYFGIGPAHTPGSSVFKKIYEIKPAHFAIVNKSGIHFEKYWELVSRPHTDNFNETCEKVKFLLDDAIRKATGFRCSTLFNVISVG